MKNEKMKNKENCRNLKGWWSSWILDLQWKPDRLLLSFVFEKTFFFLFNQLSIYGPQWFDLIFKAKTKSNRPKMVTVFESAKWAMVLQIWANDRHTEYLSIYSNGWSFFRSSRTSPTKCAFSLRMGGRSADNGGTTGGRSSFSFFLLITQAVDWLTIEEQQADDLSFLLPKDSVLYAFLSRFLCSVYHHCILNKNH